MPCSKNRKERLKAEAFPLENPKHLLSEPDFETSSEAEMKKSPQPSVSHSPSTEPKSETSAWSGITATLGNLLIHSPRPASSSAETASLTPSAASSSATNTLPTSTASSVGTTPGVPSSTITDTSSITSNTSTRHHRRKTVVVPEININLGEAKRKGELSVGQRKRHDMKKVGNGLKTIRIWHPDSKRKTLVINIGKEIEANAEAAKIFESSNINRKTYTEWRKEAKAQLPSVTGGTSIDSVEDVVEATPMMQRDGDMRSIQRTIKRLSQDSQDAAPLQQPTIVVTKANSMPRLPSQHQIIREYRLDPNANPNDSRKSYIEEIVVIESEDEEDEEEAERQLAGVDIMRKIKTLKELAEHLTAKRKIRQQLVKKATGNTILDTEEIPLKEHALYMLEYIQGFFHDAANNFNLWDSHIRVISGRFGVVVASYFTWLRRILFLNILYFLLSLIIIVIPQVDEQRSEPDRHPGTHIGKDKIDFDDLFHGEGGFHHSYMYYSGYHNRSETSDNPYRNPAFRFLFAIFLIFCFNTWFIFSRINVYYHSIRLESKVSGVANFNNFKSIICAWDFSCDDPEAAEFLHKTIWRELFILTATSKGGMKRVELEIKGEHKAILAYCVRKCGVKWGPIVMHAISSLFLLLCCAVLGSVLYFLCQFKLDYYLDCVSERDNGMKVDVPYSKFCPDGDLYLRAWILSLPAIFASLTWLVLSRFILAVGETESWDSPERKVYAAMMRAAMFDLTNIAVFYAFWISSKDEIVDEGFVSETIFGEELFRLVVLQGLFDIGLNICVRSIYHLIRRKSKSYKRPEFRSEYYALSMFSLHSLSIIGILFCPLISLFVVIRLLVDFHQQKFALLHLSSHESYASHASSVYGPYLVSFFATYLLSSSLNVFYLSQTQPSQFDGPFISYNISYDQAISRIITSGSALNSLRNIAQPGFLLTIIIVLGALYYFCYKWARAYEPIIQQLQDLILLERGDRDLLLKAIFEIGKSDHVDVSVDKDIAVETDVISTDEKHVEQDSNDQAKRDIDISSHHEVEGTVDEQITRLIKHVHGRRSLDARNLRASHEFGVGSIWHTNTGRRHREHMEMLVANIVESRKKSRTPKSGTSNIKKKGSYEEGSVTSSVKSKEERKTKKE